MRRPFKLRLHYGPSAAEPYAGTAQTLSYAYRERRDRVAEDLARLEHLRHVEVWDEDDQLGIIVGTCRPSPNGHHAERLSGVPRQ